MPLLIQTVASLRRCRHCYGLGLSGTRCALFGRGLTIASFERSNYHCCYELLLAMIVEFDNDTLIRTCKHGSKTVLLMFNLGALIIIGHVCGVGSLLEF